MYFLTDPFILNSFSIQNLRVSVYRVQNKEKNEPKVEYTVRIYSKWNIQTFISIRLASVESTRQEQTLLSCKSLKHAWPDDDEETCYSQWYDIAHSSDVKKRNDDWTGVDSISTIFYDIVLSFLFFFYIFLSLVIS